MKITAANYTDALSIFFRDTSVNIELEAHKRYTDSPHPDAMHIIIDDTLQAVVLFLDMNPTTFVSEILYHEYVNGHTEQHYQMMKIHELAQRVIDTITAHKEAAL